MRPERGPPASLGEHGAEHKAEAEAGLRHEPHPTPPPWGPGKIPALGSRPGPNAGSAPPLLALDLRQRWRPLSLAVPRGEGHSDVLCLGGTRRPTPLRSCRYAGGSGAPAGLVPVRSPRVSLSPSAPSRASDVNLIRSPEPLVSSVWPTWGLPGAC